MCSFGKIRLMTNSNNLKPFTEANGPRRQNGRRKGSKNLSTIVGELLEANMSLTEPIFELSLEEVAVCKNICFRAAFGWIQIR